MNKLMNRKANRHAGNRRLPLFLIVGLLTGLAFPSLIPRTAEAATLNQPVNVSPADGTSNISLVYPFVSSTFSPTGNDTHLASQWQITSFAGNYTNPVFDSGVDFSNKITITLPPGNLCLNTLYYWRVRYQNNLGWWSDWSAETSFKTIVSGNPSTPLNMSPVNGAIDTLPGLTLQSTAFASVDGGATHTASQWQITTTPGNYTNPVFDSGPDATNRVKLIVPPGTLLLNTTYSWRVRYQDSLGRWSDWSIETFFKTIVSSNPSTPLNMSPVNGSVNALPAITLQTTAFASLDGGATHAASQWQISAIPGNYTNPVFDSGSDATNRVKLTVPPGTLLLNTYYYWRARHEDSLGRWSDWSIETSFKTLTSWNPNTPFNLSPISGSTGSAKSPNLQSSAFVSLDGRATHAASQWEMTSISGNYTNPVFDSGLDTVNKVTITVPPGTLLLNTTYYWRVRYQDNYGNWTDWSTETSFKTIVSGNPSIPRNVSPVSGANGTGKRPTLESSPFVSLDGGATHAASQWQITAISGNYSSTAFDSGLDTTNKVTITVLPDSLYFNTIYYWRVRYQDSLGRWSGWSAETSFTTMQQPPTTPDNVAPATGATGINVTPTLNGSAFADIDVLASQLAAQWQITATSGDYSSPAYEGVTASFNKTSITIPNGKLNYGKTYYWHVRYQDKYGSWSAWSTQTPFTTMTQPPNTPGNLSPANGVTSLNLTPTLTSSSFVQPDAGDSHKATRWQITAVSGNYSNPVYDSNSDLTDKTNITIPAGKLSYATTYYWHVRYFDGFGIWSDWSAETSFTTTTQAPITPSNLSPSNESAVAGVTPTLTGSAFADLRPLASHNLSQWQITAISDNYSSPIYNIVSDINKTGITISDGFLSYNTTYYWHVRYMDSYGIWSDYSKETAVTTGVAVIKSDFSATPIQVRPGQTVTFSDNSTGDISSWAWDFGDGATNDFTSRPAGGKVVHSYLNPGSYTVSLTVIGAAGKDTRIKTSLVLASPAPSAERLPWITIITGLGVLLAGGSTLWYLHRRSQYYT